MNWIMCTGVGSHGRYVKQDVMWNTLVSLRSELLVTSVSVNENTRNFGFISKDFNGDLYRGCIVDVDEDVDNGGVLYSV